MNKYQAAVEYLLSLSEKDFKREISDAWFIEKTNPGHPLFYFCSKNLYYREEGYGCPTEVKSGRYEAFNPELTALIRSNELLPSNPEDIKQDREMLEEFARLQELMDKTIRKS